MLRKLLHITILLFMAAAIHAQSPLDTLAMRAIMVNQLFPQERVYLHFDNSAYYLGETMWFKAYVTSGLTDDEKPQSRVLYVELCAPEGYVVETKNTSSTMTVAATASSICARSFSRAITKCVPTPDICSTGATKPFSAACSPCMIG